VLIVHKHWSRIHFPES